MKKERMSFFVGDIMRVSSDGGLPLYNRLAVRRRLFVCGLFALTVLLFVLCLLAGSSGMSPWEAVRALFGDGEETAVRIVRRIRLPRVLAGVLAGAGLALAGCVMQTVLRNPMASPSTLGVSNAAVFGANVAIIVLGAGAFHSTHGETLTIANPYAVTVCAFVFAIVCAVVILALSGRHGFSPETVVLAGLALGALFTAGTTLLQYFSMDTQVAAAVFWTFGDLGRADRGTNILLAVAVLTAGMYFYRCRWAYNALANGEETAKSLGVRTERTRFLTLLLACAVTAASVSFLGIIGFVGLVSPRLVLRFTGTDHRYLLPAAALAGASLLLFSDTLARTVLTGVALPVGAVTSLFGAPVFLWLLLKKRGGRV